MGKFLRICGASQTRNSLISRAGTSDLLKIFFLKILNFSKTIQNCLCLRNYERNEIGTREVNCSD
jgi:hypothetical protein